MDESNTSLPLSQNIPPHTLESILISEEEVESTLKSLKTGKAAGSDSGNNYRLFKETDLSFSSPLSDLFNYSLSSSVVPSKWKDANVTPMYKKNDPSDVSNYRPISLLSSICKVLEKIIHKHVFNF